MRVELYRRLSAEAGSYLAKIPGIWLQKFILTGAMLAFLLTQHEQLDASSTGISSDLVYDLALGAIAVLAVLIDAKILEYSLHARVISRFIAEHLSDPPVLGEWEQTLWGEAGPARERRLVRLRSLTTVLVTTAPTVLVIILVGGAIGARRQSWVFPAVAAVGCLVYLLVTLVTWKLVWPASPVRYRTRSND